MGNSPLTVCLSQAFAKQTVQVVLPDGQVLFMPHPLTVGMLMEAHPSHIVCQGSPSLLEQRLPIHQRLESGEIYYLLPSSQVLTAVPTTPTRDLFQNIRQQQQQNKVQSKQQFNKQTRGPYKPPPADLADYARLSLKPQRCLINLFVFRQSVASIMPEESFKVVTSQSQAGDHYHQYGIKARAFVPAAAPAATPPPSTAPIQILNNKRNAPQFDNNSPKQQHHRGVRGRKQVAPWRPHLESISETKPVMHDLSCSLLPPLITNNNVVSNKLSDYINNFSVPMISGAKSFTPAPSPPGSPFPPGSPLSSLVLPLHSYGGYGTIGGQQYFQQQFCQQQQRCLGGGVIHSPMPSPLASPRAEGGDHRQRMEQAWRQDGGSSTFFMQQKFICFKASRWHGELKALHSQGSKIS
ncbi:unnamed protein product [Calypogeia fissa]